MTEHYKATNKVVGEIKMKLVENKKVIKEQTIKNMIVSKASELLALLAQPNNSGQKGIEYLAVGEGYGTGGLLNPQVPSTTDTQLKSELARKQITDYSVVGNVLTMNVVFTESEAVGEIVELGLFGGNSASSSANSGTMFSYKTFSVWNKANNAELEIEWKITF